MSESIITNQAVPVISQGEFAFGDLPETEEWRGIVGFEGYEVSNLGRVRSWKVIGGHRKRSSEPRIKTLTPDPEGYLNVGLWKNGKTILKGVHRLVLIAFVGIRSSKIQSRHIDGNPANNLLSNLEWGTAKQNADDRTRHGRTPMASVHYATEFTEETIIEIRRRRAAGERQISLAAEFGITRAGISGICVGRTWASVKEGLEVSRKSHSEARKLRGEGTKSSKITALQASEIKARLRNGESHASIASRFGVSPSYVTLMNRGKLWSEVD